MQSNAHMEKRTIKPSSESLLRLVETAGPLIDGANLRCPACENVGNILGYVPLEHSVKYVDQIVIPMKCQKCKHVFALRP